ncbi:MAG: VWA domain-containing protein [Planctomycetota bacterium]
MKHTYGPYDGKPFLSPDALFPSPQLIDFVLQYGDQAMDALQNLENPDEQDLIQQMIDAGLLEEYTDEDGNPQLRMTARMIQGMQHQALLQIFENMKRGNRDGHTTTSSGKTTERTEGTKPYEFGDPLSEVDLGATMRNVLAKTAEPEKSKPVGVKFPLPIGMDDFVLHETEGKADCATVVLIDLSGSMYRYGRFLQAKRVCLGMSELIRQKFPQDTLDFVSFYSLADEVPERDVPLIMPKPVTIRDWEVRIRVPLDQADPRKIPLHFTNLHLGLRKARQILRRRGAANKQVFIITDGQPTAHIESSPESGEEMLYLLYPPSERTSTATLKEAMLCAQQGIRFASFALIEDYWGMEWVDFIEKLTRLTRGIAYYCASDDLSSTVIESYLTGKKNKAFIQ